MKDVFITRLSKFLPNRPVSNDEMENYLGKINGNSSKAKNIILRNNQIKNRYYALDIHGKSTHTNFQLAAASINELFDETFSKNELELLCCGTVTPDQFLPSHAAMVHGELGCPSTEIISISTACCAAVQALKYAYLSIKSGSTTNAICVGSEKTSGWLTANKFDAEATDLQELEKNPIIGFEKEFLRWMLSDGAGSVLLKDKPNTEGISLRIDWIEIKSYANEAPPCMYAGCDKDSSGNLIGWAEIDTNEWATKSIFSFKQDTRLLAENIIKWGGKMWTEVCNKHHIDLESLTYFLPHLSSEFFRPRIMQELAQSGYAVHPDKFFTNLTTVGNIGSAAPFVMLEELFNNQRIKKGDTLILMIPESARFTYAYVHLTAM